MRHWKKRLAVIVAIFLGITPATASAISLIFPPIIPDIEQPVCAAIQLFLVGTPCTFTLSNEVMQAQQLLATAQNLKAAGGIGGVISIVRGELPTIEAAINAATPQHVADAAAATGATEVPNVDNQVQSVANTAVGCDGELCIDQAIAAQQTTTASEVAKTNQLLQQEDLQALNNETAFAADLNDEFGHMGGGE